MQWNVFCIVMECSEVQSIMGCYYISKLKGKTTKNWPRLIHWQIGGRLKVFLKKCAITLRDTFLIGRTCHRAPKYIVWYHKQNNLTNLTKIRQHRQIFPWIDEISSNLPFQLLRALVISKGERRGSSAHLLISGSLSSCQMITLPGRIHWTHDSVLIR